MADATSPPPRGAVRLGRLLGIDVFVHWSWAAVALIELRVRAGAYHSQVWNVVEYLALFVFVFCHEMGHSLACRSVGGTADRILLWPLGGVAFVNAPQRPGALLWSILAGPLVNVAFATLFFPFVVAGRWFHLSHDVRDVVFALFGMNVVLFLFNMIPVYPLDGGKIVQALLWFVVGRAKSLYAVSALGVVAGAATLVVAIYEKSIWFSVMAVFAVMRAVAGLKLARALGVVAAAPRRTGVVCPRCRAEQPIGAFWKCACGNTVDTFADGGACPHCHRRFLKTSCTECHESSDLAAFHGSSDASILAREMTPPV